MRHPPRILVLDFGASHVAGAVYALTQAGKLRLERFGHEAHATAPTAESETEVRARALATLAAREAWTGDCVFAAPGDQTLVKFIKLPKVEAAKRRQILKFEVAQSIPYALEDVCWDKLGLGGADGEEEMIVAAIKTEAMGGLCAALDAAGLEPQRAMPGGFALWRAWQCNYAAEGEPAWIVDVGARCTHVVLATAQRCFLRTLALGGNAITQAIADGLAIEFDQAERLKIRCLHEDGAASESAAEREVAARAADRFARRLQMELARAILGQGGRATPNPARRILLTGGGARWRGLAVGLSAKLELPVETYAALREIEGATQTLPPGADLPAHSLAVLTGLAAAALKVETPAPNILPATVQAERASRKARPWWTAAAALLALAAVPPAWQLHAWAREAAADNARWEKELAPLRKLAAQNTESLAKVEALQREVSALRRLTAARSSWQEFLANLQRELTAVEDVWLERLEVADAAASGPEPKASPPLRLKLSGRLLDVQNPVSKVSPDSFARVRDLFARIAASPFVAKIEAEQFDNSRPGILRFDFTLVMNPEHVL